MKELSIEEKAQAYDKALERAQALYNDKNEIGYANAESVLEEVFPLLKEPEDEKIRKFLIKWIQDNYYHGTTEIPTKTLIAWLEKQGESSDQIHYWTEEEIEPIISDYLRGAEHYGGMIGRLRCLKPKSLEKQGETSPILSNSSNIGKDEQKPTIEMKSAEESLGIDSETYNKIVDECIYGEQKPAWSEEDEKEYKYVLRFVDNILNNCGNKKDYEHCKRCYDWLKSLKQRIGG